MNVFCQSKLAFCFFAGCLSSGLMACSDLGSQTAAVSTSQNLRFVAAYPVDVAEPSGLSLSKDNLSLWTVSDKTRGIYQISLQGTVLSHFQSERGDLEAITTIDAQHLAFLSERDRVIVVTRNDGRIIEEAKISLSGSKNKGPEALTYDEDAEQFHVIQESPGILLSLNRQFEEVARRELEFFQDYSSISFDSERKQFWVLSDLSHSIHVLDQDLRLQQSYSIDVKQMEGIAIDQKARRIYVVSDPLSALYVFEFDPF